MRPAYRMLSGGLDAPQPPSTFAEVLVVGVHDRSEAGEQDTAAWQ
jgi:hypothetical protein